MLAQFQEHPQAWTRVDTVLEYSQNQNTKFYALSILDKVIQYRWKTLPRQQCDGIKYVVGPSLTQELTFIPRSYIVTWIIKISSDEATMQREKLYLKKLNMILVQVTVCLSHKYAKLKTPRARYSSKSGLETGTHSFPNWLDHHRAMRACVKTIWKF